MFSLRRLGLPQLLLTCAPRSVIGAEAGLEIELQDHHPSMSELVASVLPSARQTAANRADRKQHKESS